MTRSSIGLLLAVMIVFTTAVKVSAQSDASLLLLASQASEGQPQAQFELGRRLMGGPDGGKNAAEAAKWILKAAEQGYVQAQWAIGLMYSKGTGVPQSDEESAKWYQRAQSGTYKGASTPIPAPPVATATNVEMTAAPAATNAAPEQPVTAEAPKTPETNTPPQPAESAAATNTPTAEPPPPSPAKDFANMAGNPVTIKLEDGTVMKFLWLAALNIWAQETEVSNAMFTQYRATHRSGSYFGHTLDDPEQPVVEVAFDDAKGFADWLTEKARSSGQIPKTLKFHLPDSSEWQTMAAANNAAAPLYPWGDAWPPPKDWNYLGLEGAGNGSKMNNHRDEFPVTAPVTKCGKNSMDLYSIGGNVWEWTLESKANLRALRGGSWKDVNKPNLRTANREMVHPGTKANNIGFRLVLGR